MINTEILREYDIRGIYQKSLKLEDVQNIAKKISYLIYNINTPKIIIGHDGRLSSLEIKNKLINATNDINLQSIRIHKLITHNGNIGKVLFARFLSTINLDEQTRIMELNISNIEDIVNFIENI